MKIERSRQAQLWHFHKTVGQLLTQLVYDLAEYADIQQHLREEIDVAMFEARGDFGKLNTARLGRMDEFVKKIERRENGIQGEIQPKLPSYAPDTNLKGSTNDLKEIYDQIN